MRKLNVVSKRWLIKAREGQAVAERLWIIVCKTTIHFLTFHYSFWRRELSVVDPDRFCIQFCARLAGALLAIELRYAYFPPESNPV